MVFSDFVDAILHAFSTYGHLAVLAALALFALFLAWRWWRRVHLLRRTRRIPRMTVDELERRRRNGVLPLVLDVRSAPAEIERIPGAQVVDLDSALQMLASHPATAEIVTYCACPNEVSAAILAERLIAAGYASTWRWPAASTNGSACRARRASSRRPPGTSYRRPRPASPERHRFATPAGRLRTR